MGRPQFPHEVVLFVGLLTSAGHLLSAEQVLEKKWGTIKKRSPVFPFDYSAYYEDELGPKIIRCFYVFERKLDPLMIRDIKLESNALEEEGSVSGLRQWNIDPGYIDLDKIVLATTKPATYRIYLGKGIYAQSTLYFKDKAFHPWPWTYRDYKEEIALSFFKEAREEFKKAKLEVKSQKQSSKLEARGSR
ncbi:MAG: DUF4416 family protein [Chlamydiae bacterium]|nr:DUF4416 family protein [Chlamydiota bacterium]MBI3276346.1 DUF4416 family protein [Chlamydiota bacterium]